MDYTKEIETTICIVYNSSMRADKNVVMMTATEADSVREMLNKVTSESFTVITISDISNKSLLEILNDGYEAAKRDGFKHYTCGKRQYEEAIAWLEMVSA